MPVGVYSHKKGNLLGVRRSIKTEFKKGHEFYGDRSKLFQKGHTPWNKKVAVERKCPKCQKIVLRKPSHAFLVHCSTRCARLGIRLAETTKEKMRQAHLKPEAKVHRRERYYHYMDKPYRDWRKAVFERDNYVCQDCGAKGGYLTAHHIKSWAKYPELRYELSNGKTLCEPCHTRTDNYKGRAKKLIS